jgi:hypothetical protein
MLFDRPLSTQTAKPLLSEQLNTQYEIGQQECGNSLNTFINHSLNAFDSISFVNLYQKIHIKSNFITKV